MKYTASNLVDRYKAKLVAHSFMQTFGINYEKTFSPTLQHESLRMLISLATYYDFEIEQMDVPNAYLKGTLEEKIYMEIREGLTLPPGTKDCVLRFKKSLYGLKQSGWEWNKRILQFLNFIGYKAITSDICIFVNHATKLLLPYMWMTC